MKWFIGNQTLPEGFTSIIVYVLPITLTELWENFFVDESPLFNLTNAYNEEMVGYTNWTERVDSKYQTFPGNYTAKTKRTTDHIFRLPPNPYVVSGRA